MTHPEPPAQPVRLVSAPSQEPDAAPALQSPTAPAGAPAVKTPGVIGRRERAEVMRRLSGLLPKAEAVQNRVETAGGPDEIDVAAATDMFDLMADTEDFIVLVAVDPAAMRAWAADASEQDVLAVFARFAASFTAQTSRAQAG